MPGELNIQATLARDVVNSMDKSPQPQKTYVLLRATPSGAQITSVEMPLNLSLVLDRSGSMSGDKIKNLRQAVHALIDLLQPTDLLSIVLFDEMVEVPLPARPAVDKIALHGIVDRIEERGGTQMSLGLEKGLAEVSRNHEPGRINKIILLTDGNSWGDEAECLASAKQAGKNGIPIVALGLGLAPCVSVPGLPQLGAASDDWNHALLDQIAHSSGGTSDLIDAAEKMITVFQNVVKTAKATVVRNARLLLRTASEVYVSQVWQVLPLIRNLSSPGASGSELQAMLGDIDKGLGQSVLVELVLPPKTPGKTPVARAEITYDVPAARRIGEQVAVDISIEYGLESVLNAHIANVIERISAHKLQTRALQDVQAGNIQGATQKLRQAATQLLNMGEQDLAQAALQEVQNLQQMGQMSSAGTKQLNYGTRKLTQNLGDGLTVSLPTPS